MINRNELRLNNLLNYEDEIFKIVQINDSLICMIQYLDDSITKMVDLNECEPIPLTEELLVKCGYTRDSDNGGIYPRDYFFEKDLYYYDFNTKYFGKVIPLEYNYEENLVQIEYLHQLQNLTLDLTGKN